MNKTVIVINGQGGCGKDTICNIMAKYYKIKNISTVDPIKDIAKYAGWNGEKGGLFLLFFVNGKASPL